MTASTGSSAAPAPDRRLTPFERLHEVTMAAMERRPTVPTQEVEITRNAKGDIQFSVTVRGLDVHECEQAAEEVVARLQRVYPREPELVPDKPAAPDANKQASKAAAIARNMAKA